MENVISPRSGTSFTLKKGQYLKVIDPQGEQVSDIYCFNQSNKSEFLSSGRTLDYNEGIHFGKGSLLYSNQSNIMLEIVEDTVESHDFLLTPCSKDTFKHFYPDETPVPGCHGNLVSALSPYDIPEHFIGTTFNIFMNVKLDENGKISVLPPTSKAGDFTIFKAHMDLIVGLTACSAGESNNFSYKPINYVISDQN
ncbi:DUF1989 domain-containing protein [Alteromonas ponticola]|uniref:Urea carboxylase-associated family protein n=1 Tax=Alteromonas ponticola TaxID=2720613 RepID=A0ABX1R276_9ALTE|nr:urea carboxylase-associated family protein [Alteromonas ponticola]NMH60557.1 urea carboxylase-associated family protein [Alteromonas ponticola]